MIASSPLEKALPGRENAKDWLTMKIVECLSVPMDDETSKKLANYNSAYNAICQWEEDSLSSSSTKKMEFIPESTFSTETAKTWTKNMENADGTQGPHWSLEQTKQMMAQRKLSFNPSEFWVALNLVYSDFSQVAKKHGMGGSLEFYIDMAKAFLDDKDAQPDKLMHYYESIVK